jgi:CheY-like chemotaxis protein
LEVEDWRDCWSPILRALTCQTGNRLEQITYTAFVKDITETRKARRSTYVDAEAALNAITGRCNDIDAVLTDNNMPRMTGLGLSRALRDACTRSALPDK